MCEQISIYYRLVVKLLMLIYIIISLLFIIKLKKRIYYKSMVIIPSTIKTEDIEHKDKFFKLSNIKETFVIIFFSPQDCYTKIEKIISSLKTNKECIAVGFHQNSNEFWTWIKNFNLDEGIIKSRIFLVSKYNLYKQYYFKTTPVKVKIKHGEIIEISRR